EIGIPAPFEKEPVQLLIELDELLKVDRILVGQKLAKLLGERLELAGRDVARRKADRLGLQDRAHVVKVARVVERQGLHKGPPPGDRKSTRLNSSHVKISY